MRSRKLSLKGVFKTGIVFIVAKSDEIDKKAHLAFSRKIMGADILEKLSLKLSFITLCIAKNSLYHSMHATHSQKLSLSANFTHLAFSHEIMGAAILEKLSLSLCACHA